MSGRRAGILLHPTSLPGPYGIGTIGSEARRWTGFLRSAGQSLWQVMPLGPTGYGDSPYQSFSSAAGNPLLIDLDALLERGLLSAAELAPLTELPEARVEYGALIPLKFELLALAAERYLAGVTPTERAELTEFERANAHWLSDYALFMALKEAHGGASWNDWEPPLRARSEAALKRARRELAGSVSKHTVWQHWFRQQWRALRAEAASGGVSIIGDLPIFVAFDSADVWANQALFHLDERGAPTVVAGVPPDYFSSTGQRWGNPLYRWEAHEANGYAWWAERVRASLELFDLVRFDHFRGFAAYWEIPAAEPTAVRGRWVRGPGERLFKALEAELGELPFIAEDLGVITPDVDELRSAVGLPGMKVLQFAFAGSADDPYLPHNYPRECVVYTGTHDNDTTAGWFAAAPEEERDRVRRYLGRGGEEIAWDLSRLALASVAETAILPLQDVLGLGSGARMNTPGTTGGNWAWRFSWEEIPDWVAPALREMVELYGRAPDAPRTPVDTPYRQSRLN